MTDTNFVCPIDDRICLTVPESMLLTYPHCITAKPNSECPFIKVGCIGCRFDKEEILKKRK